MKLVSQRDRIWRIKKINILSVLNKEECLKIINENHAESLEIAERIFDKENDKDILDYPVAYLNYDYKRKLWYDKNAKYSRVINKKIKSYGIY